MSSLDTKSVVLGVIALVLLVCVAYQYDPTLFGLYRRMDGFADATDALAKLTEAKETAAEEDTTYTTTTASPSPKAKASPSPKATASPSPKVTASPSPTATGSGFKGGISGFKGGMGKTEKEGFADLASMEGPAAFASAEAPAGCYPRDQLTPTELLPADQNTIYAQQNPMGVGSLKGKNFLSAGALIGVNTVGQSLRNANLQLRSEPPNPQVPVSIFLQSTIGPDISHRPLEVGS
jgi:hypothetical protein